MLKKLLRWIFQWYLRSQSSLFVYQPFQVGEIYYVVMTEKGERQIISICRNHVDKGQKLWYIRLGSEEYHLLDDLRPYIAFVINIGRLYDV